MLFSSGNIGGFIIPVIAGYILELYGSFYPAVIFSALVFGVIALLSIPLEETGVRPASSKA
jgi:fucose permease